MVTTLYSPTGMGANHDSIFARSNPPATHHRQKLSDVDTMSSRVRATISTDAGRPGSSEVPRNPLTRWDVSSIPANGIFLAKKKL